ncbi:MAG: divalent-cation tolerance protein CutA [Sphingomonadales bacterium]|nr:MAG: divalent-cation tolerance protein CutA [Sphingomonadales bacterium]
MTALIWCPFPDRESARHSANILLDEKLIACANLIGQMESIFDWDGKRDSGEEFGVLFKTDAGRLDQAVDRLAELHPYDIPAIMGWRCDSAPKETRNWLRSLSQE